MGVQIDKVLFSINIHRLWVMNHLGYLQEIFAI